MTTNLLARISAPVLAFVFGLPLAAQAGPYDRAFDSIERQAAAAADQARHALVDVLKDVHNPRLRADMVNESRTAMTSFLQIRALARQQRVVPMGPEAHRALDSLARLDKLVHQAERDEARAHAGHGPDIHHIHEAILDLQKRARSIDDLIHQIEGSHSPIRYQANYPPQRPVYAPPVQPAPPRGISVGGRGFRIRIGR